MTTLLDSITGRWNGDSNRIVYDKDGFVTITQLVCYLKVSLDEEKSIYVYRIIYTDRDALTHKLTLEFAQDSEKPGAFVGRAPHDEYYSKGKLSFESVPNSPDTFVLSLMQPETGLRISTQLRRSTDGSQLAITSTSYDDQGLIVSCESACLRPCDPMKPPSYPVVDALGGWEVETETQSSVTATEVDE